MSDQKLQPFSCLSVWGQNWWTYANEAVMIPLLENPPVPRLLLPSLKCHDDGLIHHTRWSFCIFRMREKKQTKTHTKTKPANKTTTRRTETKQTKPVFLGLTFWTSNYPMFKGERSQSSQLPRLSPILWAIYQSLFSAHLISLLLF